MRLETIPVIIGALFALFGLWVGVDAWLPEKSDVQSERRRRARAQRSRPGQTAVALGLFCIAAALIGRDTWRYGTVAVIAGAVLLLLGAILNRRFLYESFAFRGAARRSPDGSVGAPRRPSAPAAGSAQKPSAPTPTAGAAPDPAVPMRERRKEPRG